MCEEYEKLILRISWVAAEKGIRGANNAEEVTCPDCKAQMVKDALMSDLVVC